jgi:hypothetical protein
MSTEWRETRGIRYAPSAQDPAVWEYLPRTPMLRRGPDGSPLLTLIGQGTSGFLLVTVTWGAPDSDIAAVRSDIAAQISAASPDLVRLAFAPLTAPRCTALIGDGAGGFESVATSSTSGTPPYDALFNVALQDEQLAAARAAIDGGPGRLAVEYEALALLPASATATFTASGPALGDRIAVQGDRRGVIDLLDTAVQEGAATVRLEQSGDDVGSLPAETYARLLEEAARALTRDRPGGPGDVVVTVSLDRPVLRPVRAFADIGTVLAAEPARVP